MARAASVFFRSRSVIWTKGSFAAAAIAALLVGREAAAQSMPSEEPPAEASAPAPVETTPPVAPSEPAFPAPTPPAAAVTTAPPTFPFAKRGTILLSIDQALPLFSFGGVPATSQALVSTALGDSTARVLRPVVVDVLLTDRLTFGGSIFVQQTLTDSTLETHIGGGLVRVGGMFPLTSKLAVWPRLAGSYITSTKPEDFAYFQLSVDAKLLYAPRRSWAFSIGPSIDIPFDDRQHFTSGSPDHGVMPVATADNRLVRIGVSAGITGRLGRSGGDDEESADAELEPTLLIGIDRVVPLIRYTASSTKTNADEQTAKNFDVATAQLAAYSPQAPRLSVDYRTPFGLTVGMSGSVGWEKVSMDRRSLFPSPTGMTMVSYALSPRAGYYKSLTKGIAVWPRVGVTYVNSAIERSSGLDGDDDYHLGFDLDAFFVFSPTPGFGLLLGPSLEVPLTGKTEVAQKRAEYSVFSVGLAGGLVVGL
ncbi:hypothetical protein [Labilithrix luteola]|nr:hypothetical protein [Labilithrix luteola]